jgi:hypothetical protein
MGDQSWNGLFNKSRRQKVRRQKNENDRKRYGTEDREGRKEEKEAKNSSVSSRPLRPSVNSGA